MESRRSSIDSDPSRPLNPDKTSRPATPGSLNPEMAYRPPAPHASGQLRDGNDGDNDRHLGGFVITGSVIIRLLTGVFALAAGIAGAIQIPARSIERFLVVLDFLTLSWSLIAMLISCCARDRKKPIGGGRLPIPEVSLTIGRWKYYYCGNEDSVDYGDADYDDLVLLAPKKSVHAGLAPFDGLICALYLFFTILSLDESHRTYINEQARIGVIVLHWFVFIFEAFLFFLDHISDKTGLNVSISTPPVSWVRENNYKYHIQLPRDDEMAGAGSRRPVAADA